MVIEKPITEDRALLEICPRLKAELARRIRELEGRANPTPHDLRELESLREFLRTTPIEGR